MWSPEGRTLGTYQVHERIGQGGMATVYRAQHLRLGSDAAIKVLAINLAGQEHFLLRFQREASSVAALQHPNILSVWDYGEQDGLAYMVMPYVRGGTLRDRLARGGLPTSEALDYLDQLAEALDYAHERGLVHRDVKPANVLLDGRGHLYLADFGIAKALEGTESLTRTGLGVGTPEYMAPEQARGQADRRADLYALGIIAYQLLSGRVPYSGGSSVEVLMQHLQSPVPLEPLRGRVPEPVLGVLVRALAKDPNQRYGSAREFVEALKAALAGSGPRPVGPADMAQTVVAPAGPPGNPATPSGWSAPAVPPQGGNWATPTPTPQPPGWATPQPQPLQPPPPIVAPAPAPVAAPPRRNAGLIAAIAAVVVVALCGIGGLGVFAATRPDSNATATARSRSTAAAFVAQNTATAAAGATATARVPTATPVPPTNTAVPPTATALPPTATRAPTAPPTATNRPSAAPSAPTPIGGYGANFRTWSSEPGDDFKRGFDAATEEYRIAVTGTQNYSFFAPDSPVIADFSLDLEARRLGGPDTTRYGVVFRAQQKGAADKASARLIFYVTSEGSFGVDLVAADGTSSAVQGRTSQRAVAVGGETNRLNVTAKGDKVTLSINGTVVGTYTVKLTSPGWVGVYVGNPASGVETEVGFKYLRLAPVP